MKHLFFLAACSLGTLLTQATSYTWTGSTSTAWNTAANWTPSGVPGSTDRVTINQASGNMPLLHADLSIGKLFLPQGVLNLGGYTLSLSDSVVVSGNANHTREINNGTLLASAAYILVEGGTFGAAMRLTSDKPIVQSGTFGSVVCITKTGSGNASCKAGSTFQDSLIVLNTGSGSYYMGDWGGTYDVHNGPALYKNTSTGHLYPAYYTAGHQYNDHVHVSVYGGGGIQFAANPSGNASLTVASGKNVVADSLASGNLWFNNTTLSGSGTLQLIGTSATTLGINGTLHRKLVMSAGAIHLGSGTYHAPVRVSQTGSVSSAWRGGATFNDSLHVLLSGSGGITIDQFGANTHNGILRLSHSGTGILAANYYYAGTQYNHDIIIEQTGGTIRFGQSGAATQTATLASGKKIITQGCTAGLLSIKRLRQAGTDSLSLSGTGTYKIELMEYNRFDGPLHLSAAEVLLGAGLFYGPVYALHNGTSTALMHGGNIFYHNASFTATHTGHIILALNAADTYHGNLSLRQESTGQVFAAYSGTNALKGNLLMHQSTASAVGTAGTLLLDGTANQSISKTGSANPLIRRLTLNKASGSVTLNTDVDTDISLTLTKGILNTTTHTLRLAHGTTLSGASDSSHVVGKLRKTGNQAFSFPLGSGTRLYPLSITAPGSSTDAFEAEYKDRTNDTLYDPNDRDGSIYSVNNKGYYILNRTNGNHQPLVTLTWFNEENDCQFLSTNNLRTLVWHQSHWTNIGNSLTTSQSGSGTVKSSIQLSNATNILTHGTANEFMFCNETHPGEQLDCGTQQSTTDTLQSDSTFINSAKAFNTCTNRDLYLPSSLSQHDTLTIGVVINIFQKTDGTGNFADSPQIREAFAEMFAPANSTGLISRINNRFANIALPNPPFGTTQHIADSKVRFTLKEVRYIKNDFIYYQMIDTTLHYRIDTVTHSPLVTDTVFFPFHRSNVNANLGKNTENEMNIFVCYGTNNNGNGYGYAFPSSLIPNVYMIDRYSVDFNPFANNDNMDGFVGLLAHEIGHTGNLNHTMFPNSGCPNNIDYDAPTITDTYYPDYPCWCQAGTIFNTCTLGDNSLLNKYRSTNNILGYNTTRNYLSPQQMAQFRRQYTNNREMKYFECKNYNLHTIIDSAYNVNYSPVWSTPVILKGNLIVRSGYVLDVRCIVGMPKGSKVIVEQGARLIIDGGVFASSCGDDWEGIEVWGNPTSTQGNINQTRQGVVRIINNGTIQDARIGILTGKADDCCNFAGGIIQTNKALFLNNRRDVAFMAYKFNNISNFVQTTFRTTRPMLSDDYLINETRLGASTHVSLWAVRGVIFEDCEFSNSINYTLHGVNGNFIPDNRGYGIFAIDTYFKVYSTNPLQPQNRAIFTNLNQGIATLKTTPGFRKLIVQKAYFTNNVGAITLEGSSTDLVENCTFSIPQINSHATWGALTIANSNSKILDNTFSGTGAASLKYGVVNRGTMATVGGGLVKGNTFQNLFVASQAEQNNPHLKWRCNTYTTNTHDWSLNPASPGGTFADQGTGCDPDNKIRAGNTFDEQTDNIRSWAAPWRYYARGNDDPTGPYTVPTLQDLNTDWTLDAEVQDCQLLDDNSCTAGGGNPPQPPHDFATLKGLKKESDLQLAFMVAAIDSITAALDSGQTDTLLARIANNGYTNAQLLADFKNKLLSDTVLLTSANRNFSEAQFVSIYNANSPLSTRVWAAVQSQIASFKVENRDSIRAAQYTDTVQTLALLSRELNQLKNEAYHINSSILDAYYTADSIPALLSYLADTLATPFYRKLAIGLSIEYDSLSLAASLLDSLPLFTKQDTAFHQYFGIAIAEAADSLSWFGLDSLQLLNIQEIASDTTLEVSIHAQAVMALLNDTIYRRTPEPLPGGYFKMADNPQSQTYTPETPANEFKVFPNPSENRFTFSYKLAQKSNIDVSVKDLQGRVVFKTQLLEAHNGEINIDLSPCNGMYIIYASDAIKQIYNSKIICISR